MPLLNYTTTIDPTKTVGEIQACLVKHGASDIMTSYAAGLPSGISFVVPTAAGPATFRLPANIPAVEKTLALQHRRSSLPRRFANPQQAARVAWRILKDWIEAQMAIVETGMVSLDEVMLPYMVQGDRTMYQFVRESRLALAGPKAEG